MSMFENCNFQEEYDYFLYVGPVQRSGYERLTDMLERNSQKDSKSKVYFILVTTGGDANAGFRIARALGHHYTKDIKVFIPDICKSAGTLITIGAKEVIISDRGELGPLDVQFRNKEELFEMSSGLDIIKSLQVLKEEVAAAFTNYLLDLRRWGIGTKMATKLASDMASNLISPIASQIDPIKLGEHQRALSIAMAYGKQLRAKFENINLESIEKLTFGYPSHGFVIDRNEASTLFKRVNPPNADESVLELTLRDTGIFLSHSDEQPSVFDLKEEAIKEEAKDEHEDVDGKDVQVQESEPAAITESADA